MVLGKILVKLVLVFFQMQVVQVVADESLLFQMG